MSSKLQIRVVSPWFDELETDDAYFSVNLPAERADALLCEWAPSEELFTFPRRKAWYCCEPACQFDGLGGGTWPSIRRRLGPHEFLTHNHPDLRFRVPHITHFDSLEVCMRSERPLGAVAIVSNHGGSAWRRHPDLTYRNRFATDHRVDLYGRDGWRRYQAGRFSRRRSPANYRGPVPGDWPAQAKRELLTQYRVSVCLENMQEPHYFTEKMVEAVCAGCVPVYRAHPTVKETMLRGAVWVDPARFNNDVSATLDAALAMDEVELRQQNVEWLRNSSELRQTHHRAVFGKISRILALS